MSTKPARKLLLIFLVLILMVLACDFGASAPDDDPFDDSHPEDVVDLDDEDDKPDDDKPEDQPKEEPEDTPAPVIDPKDFMSSEIFDIKFTQMDFTTPDGLLTVENSCWGRVDWSYIPPPDQIHYFNLVSSPDGEGPGVWVTHNLPLFPPTDGDFSERREAAFFNLCDLGIDEGTTLDSSFFQLQVSDTLLSEPPTSDAPFTLWGIEPRIFNAGYQVNWQDPDSFVAWPGTPINIVLDAEPTLVNEDKYMYPVQEGDSQCLAGSFARSIDWLNQEHSMGSDLTGQQIFDGLTGVGVSDFDDALSLGANMAKQIKLKDTYANSITGSQIQTTVWDPGTNVDPVQGMSEDNGDFLEWLNANANNDLEVGYFYPGNAHIVTVLDVYTKNGETWVKYRDDEKQGDDSKGDKGEKHAKIYKPDNNNDGVPDDDTYRFGSDRNKIYMGFAESYYSMQKDWEAFASLLVGDWKHEVGESEVEGGVIVLKADPIPAANATVTFMMTLPDGSTQTQTSVTDETGFAETSFTIYYYGEYIVSIEDIEGEGIVYAPEKNLANEISVDVVGGDTEDFYAADAVLTFYDIFNVAFGLGDIETLLSLLHKETLQLYGYDACYTYLESVISSPVMVKPLAITEFGLWVWEMDGRSIPILNAYTVEVEVTVNNEKSNSILHLGLNDDATLGWFTDCGEPLP